MTLYEEYQEALAQLLQEFQSFQDAFAELDALCDIKDELCATLSLHVIAHTIFIRLAPIAQFIPFIVFSPRWHTAATGT